MWITQRLQGHSSHSITTVHSWWRDGRQEDSEGIVVKEQGGGRRHEEIWNHHLVLVHTQGNPNPVTWCDENDPNSKFKALLVCNTDDERSPWLWPLTSGHHLYSIHECFISGWLTVPVTAVAAGFSQRQVLEEDPSMCDQGLPLQVLALDSTRTSEVTQYCELLNFVVQRSRKLIWHACEYSFPYSV